ncbi:MAG: hypothetical protein M3R55_03885 [Acidobacteriota bacterium]|nr:hypothetical protein [Acidobacteriota bacterium]
MTFALASFASVTLLAQSPGPQTPPTYEQQVFATWRALHQKLLAMAKDFPEDKYA